MIQIHTISLPRNTENDGWDSSLCSGGDYQSARGLALYDALGVALDDEYTLAKHEDGRWGLFGPNVEGRKFAIEVEDPPGPTDDEIAWMMNV